MKLTNLVFLLLATVPVIASFGQSFPKNFHYDEDAHRLSIELHDEEGFYNIDEIAEINLEFYNSNYWNLLHSYYDTDTYLPAKLYYNGELFDSVGVQFKGQTSYRLAKQQGSTKFSFDIKTGEYIEDQEILGYSTLNLNNFFDDHTFMREVLYGRLAGKHIPAARGNYVKLYLNGEYWGLYANIQQVNNDFLREWFPSNDGIRWRADVSSDGGPGGPPGPPGGQWGDGTAALNDHGTDTTEYQKYYTLKSTDLDNPWDYLVEVCQALEAPESSSYLQDIKKLLDLDATLWHLATEILFSDDDSYVYKGKMDYSLFYEEASGQMHPLEIDGNSILGSKNLNWGPFYHVSNENYPLLNRLLTIPELRQRYLAHVRTILNDSFNQESQEKIDEFKAFIEELVEDDPKTLTTFSRFNTDVTNLRNYIITRRDYIMNHPEVNITSPEITEFVYTVNGIGWETPKADDEIDISCFAEHDSGIKSVKLWVSKSLDAPFVSYEMIPDEGYYNQSLSGFQPGDFVRMYVEAISNNAAGTRRYYPDGAEHEVIVFKVLANTQEDSDVVINELMASNASTVQDQDGEYDDWVELFNKSSSTVDLCGYYLSDKSDNLTKWEIPEGTTIEANGYLVIWTDENGSEEGLHANFKLSKAGEELYLMTPDVSLADHVIFGPQETDQSYARVPNGTGDFVIQSATFATNNDTATASEEISHNASWLFYPNPARNVLHFSHKSSTYMSTKLVIYDISGIEILKTEITHEMPVDISGLNPGLYIMKIENDLFKLVKY